MFSSMAVLALRSAIAIGSVRMAGLCQSTVQVGDTSSS